MGGLSQGFFLKLHSNLEAERQNTKFQISRMIIFEHLAWFIISTNDYLHVFHGVSLISRACAKQPSPWRELGEIKGPSEIISRV